MNSWFPLLSGLLRACWIVLAAMFLLSTRAAETKPSPANDLLERSREAFQKGLSKEAFELADQAIKADPKNAQAYFFRAGLYDSTGQREKAAADFSEVLKLDPDAPRVLQLRGESYFRMGKIAEALKDFDKVVELVPSQRPHHWQRGIALYYAKRFEEGRKQFESHQTVNQRDVENAVWHFACVARQSDVESARRNLIQIDGDRRVPMAQIHALFAGKATPEDVLEAAEAGNPAPAELNNRMLYAHLYLGLYHEVNGNPARSREHITKAAGEFRADHYMGAVAQVHAQLQANGWK
jgi:lipoprotein NlpI